VSWKSQGLYLWRTRKPHAMVGPGMRVLLPASIVLAWAAWMYGEGWWWLCFLLALFSGRHNAYVGHTKSRYFRDNQHRFGDSRYGAAGKPWMDLDAKVYPLPCLFPRNKLAREIQEKLWIFMLLPVYNVEWNTKNPRRIKPVKAQQQRWARQSKRWGWIMPRVARIALYGVVLIGATYSGWEKWF
jgi:hypothetical protein